MFLRAPVAASQPYRYISYEEAEPVAEEVIIAVVGHEPFLPPMLDVVMTGMESSAASTPAGWWIGLGAAAVVLTVAVDALTVQRRRRRGLRVRS